MILAFLMKVFFKIVYEIIAFIVNLIIFAIKALGTVFKEIFLVIINAIKEHRANKKNLKSNSDKPNSIKEDISVPEIVSSLSVKKTSGKLMYAIVRREESGEWIQSKPIESYDEARTILRKERRLTVLPRIIKKVYV